MRGTTAQRIDAIARTVAVRALDRHEPAVDIEGICERFQIAVRLVPMRGDGKLVLTPRGATITVNGSHPEARRRFTIAHELGHLALERSIGGPVEADLATYPEAFCNEFAASLMLPRDWMLDQTQLEPGLRTLWDICAGSGTSLSAALVRARDLLGWHCVLVHWTLSGGQWVLDGQAGLAGTATGYLTNSEATTWQLHGLRDNPRKNDLTVRWNGQDMDLRAEARVGFTEAIAILWLPNDTPPRPQRLSRRGRQQAFTATS